MLERTTHALHDFYKYGLLDRIFIKLQTRSLGARFERYFVLLPVLIFMDSFNQAAAIERTKNFLLENVEPKNLALKVYDRIMLKLFSYQKDNAIFIQERKKAFDILSQNIQLYGLVEVVLSRECEDAKRLIEDVVKKQYDSSFNISGHTQRLLRFQEEHYLQ